MKEHLGQLQIRSHRQFWPSPGVGRTRGFSVQMSASEARQGRRMPPSTDDLKKTQARLHELLIYAKDSIRAAKR